MYNNQPLPTTNSGPRAGQRQCQTCLCKERHRQRQADNVRERAARTFQFPFPWTKCGAKKIPHAHTVDWHACFCMYAYLTCIPTFAELHTTTVVQSIKGWARHMLLMLVVQTLQTLHSMGDQWSENLTPFSVPPAPSPLPPKPYVYICVLVCVRQATAPNE